MEILDYVMHIDKNLSYMVSEYKAWTYLILSFVVFLETGLFMAPFLPEESLLFVVGTVAATGALDIYTITPLLITVNLIGETFNYYIGLKYGPSIFSRESSIIFNKNHIDKALKFYERRGPKTIVIGKYIPLIRTFVPFVAGMIKIPYKKFIVYNMIGGIPWVCASLLGGYFFGNIPLVSDNFILVILFIVIVSVSPGIVSIIRSKISGKSVESENDPA